MLKLFNNRNFSYLFWGRVVTNMGDSLYNVAAMWLVYEMTHSPLYTGIAGALIMIPQVLEFLVGPLVDRWRLRSILLFTQLFQGCLILLIPTSYYLGFISVWLVMSIMFGVVAIEQFVYPAQSAMIPKVLTKEELPEANSLMNIAYKGADFLLTALAGILIVKIGAINIYLINSVTFLLAIMLFKNIHYQDNKQGKIEKRSTIESGFKMYKKELIEGFSFVKHSSILQFIIPLIIANFVFGMVNAILPAYADFRGGESYYGYYLASLSIGMLSGSLLATYFKKIPLGKVIILSFLFSSIAWGGSFLVGSSILSVILFGISTIGIGVANLLIFTMIQSILPEDMMGRVFSFISSIATILLPLGSFIGGYMATIIGSEYIFGAGSLLCFVIVFYWTTNHSLRSLPSYLEITPDTYLKKKSAS